MSVPGETAIQLERIGKRYRLGALPRAADTLRDRVPSLLRRRNPANETKELWALRDVNLTVNRGDILGIIGRNGAGKSTLLKILSRITPPTEGRATIRGRVSSLLEVGTGFHPELTGRENIFLNGAVLGMSRAEIRAAFDSIVDFADIGPFLDTPVKRYSSGMHVRLGFAVAAHLLTEVLLVDEVLAVGDVAFQNKCLGRMDEIGRSGRTVLFVSHTMATVQRLCTRAILLDRGTVVHAGTAAETVDRYLDGAANSELQWNRGGGGDGPFWFERVWVADEGGRPVTRVTSDMALNVHMEFRVAQPARDLQLRCGLVNAGGDVLFMSAPLDGGQEAPSEPGVYRAAVRFPAEILMPRTYSLRCALWLPRSTVRDVVEDIRFPVAETASLATSIVYGRPGQIALRCPWTIERVQ